MNETLTGINRVINPSVTFPAKRDDEKRERIHLSNDNTEENDFYSTKARVSNNTTGTYLYGEGNKNSRQEKSLNEIKNQERQSSLVGHYTILSHQIASDGKHTIKLKVNVSDKKGRVALGMPVLFNVNHGAVPALFNTLTDISGDATFEFVNYHRGNMLVSVRFDGQEKHIPISLK